MNGSNMDMGGQINSYSLRVTSFSYCYLFMQIPLPQPRDTSGSPFTPIQFNEESGRMDDGGYEEVDTHADQSSVDGLAKEERGEKERQLTRWSMVGDNKLAEEEEVEKRNGKVARGKDSGGSKVSWLSLLPLIHTVIDHDSLEWCCLSCEVLVTLGQVTYKGATMLCSCFHSRVLCVCVCVSMS